MLRASRNSKILVFLFFIIIILVNCSKIPDLQQKNNDKTTISEDNKNNPAYYKISDIKKNKFSSGIYQTDGYVIYKTNKCPPCPAGAACSPCFAELIIISEDQNARIDILESKILDNQLIILVDPEKFEFGNKYKFTIRVTDRKIFTFDDINDIELVSFKNS